MTTKNAACESVLSMREGKGDWSLLSGISKQWWKIQATLVKWKQFAVVQYLVGAVHLHTGTVKDAT